jgi:hypothetical protein
MCSSRVSVHAGVNVYSCTHLGTRGYVGMGVCVCVCAHLRVDPRPDQTFFFFVLFFQ